MSRVPKPSTQDVDHFPRLYPTKGQLRRWFCFFAYCGKGYVPAPDGGRVCRWCGGVDALNQPPA